MLLGIVLILMGLIVVLTAFVEDISPAGTFVLVGAGIVFFVIGLMSTFGGVVFP